MEPILKLLLISILTLSFTLTSQAAELKTIKDYKEYILKNISKAYKCMPKMINNHYQFCSGVSLSQNELKNVLNQSFKLCRETIKKNGYEVELNLGEGKYKGSLPTKEYKEFVNSTKRAEAFHDKKIIVFKKEAQGKVDCIHELIHVYQRLDSNKSPFNPKIRGTLFKKYQSLLMVEAEKVANLSTKKAKEMEKRVLKHIETLKLWGDLVDLLDEKEVYYFILKHCDELKCNRRDKDIALANLKKRKNFISKKDYKYIQNEINLFLKN